MQLSQLIIGHLFHESIEVVQADPESAELIIESLVVDQSHLQWGDVSHVVFKGSHQQLDEPFLMVAVREDVPHVGQIQLSSTLA